MRVISLVPSATEIVAALGAFDTLVGVTHACDFPAAVAGLPRVTSCDLDASAGPGVIDTQMRALASEGRSLYTLDADLIRSLCPDLIITQALCGVCAVMDTDVCALAARLDPAPGVVSLAATNLDGVFDDIALVARALTAEDEAEELLAGLRRRMRVVHDVLATAHAPRPRVVVLEWSEPSYAGGHWVPEQVRRAGGADVLARAGDHSKMVPLDVVVAAGADIVLFAPCGHDLTRATEEARRMRAQAGWGPLAGLPLWALDANALTSRPGPRLVDGIEVMARIFNPAVFSPLTPGHATRVDAPAPAGG